MNGARQQADIAVDTGASTPASDLEGRVHAVFAALEPGLAEDFRQRFELLTHPPRPERSPGDSRAGETAPAAATPAAASTEALASLLMEAFAKTRNLEAFSLLYEVTHRQILLVILKRVRYSRSFVDPKDVLQDVFLSIYRYPHRFRNEKASSFRNWSFSIVRNTLLKHLRSAPRPEVDLDPLAEIVEDERTRAPITVLEDDEENERAALTYALCLLGYRRAFHQQLKDREKKALRLIEVKGLKYRDAAEKMDVRLENLKMIVCRARKKLLRSIEELLEGPES